MADARDTLIISKTKSLLSRLSHSRAAEISQDPYPYKDKMQNALTYQQVKEIRPQQLPL